MTIYEIKAPSNYTGEGYGLKWIDGKAETSDKRTADRLKAKGYVIIETEAETPPLKPGTGSDNVQSQLPANDRLFLDNMSAEQLKAYAEENSIDIGQATSEKTLKERISKALDEVLPKPDEVADIPSGESDEVKTLSQNSSGEVSKMDGGTGTFIVTASDEGGGDNDGTGDPKKQD